MSFGGNFPAMTGLSSAVDGAVVLGGPVDKTFGKDVMTNLPFGTSETYLVISCLEPWHACRILIDDKSDFDLAKEPDAEILWQIDQKVLTSLTK